MEAQLFIFAAVAISEVFSACKPTDTKFKNFQKTPKRSQTYFIEVVTTSCPGLNELYYNWEITEASGKKGVVKRSDKSSVFIDGYSDFDSATCFQTDYIVTVKVSHYPDMSSYDEKKDIFYFQADLMQIRIVGGYQRPHRIDKDLVLDAESISVDTSYPPDQNAFKGNVVSWKIDPPIEGFTPPARLKIVVPSRFLKSDEVYFFTVKVVRKKIIRYPDVQEAEQMVNIVPIQSPDVEVKCMKNCKKALSWESTVFVADCKQHCQQLQYSWTIAPTPANGTLHFAENNMKVVMDAHAYNDGDQLYLTLQAGPLTVIQSLKYVSGMVAGNCTVKPQTGISAVTKFEITCTGFSSPYGLARCLIYHHKGLNKDLVLLAEYIYSEVTELFIPPGNPSLINIVIEDRAFLRAHVTLEIPVKDYQPKLGAPLKASVKTLVLSREYNSITSYSMNGFNNQVVQLICCLLPTIKSFDSATARDLHKHMVEALERTQPVRLTSVIQRLLVLAIIEKYKLKTDSITSRLIAKVMLQDASNIHFIFVHHDSTNIPTYYVRLTFEHSMRLSLNLLNISNDLTGILKQEIAPHNYDSYDEFESRKLQVRDDCKKMLSDIVVAMQTNFLTMLFSEITEKRAIIYDSDKFYGISTRTPFSKKKKKDVSIKLNNETKPAVVLPFDLVLEHFGEHSFLDYQLGVFKMNPFWWHESNSAFKTRIIFFDLFWNCRKFKELSKPFFIYLDLLEIPTQSIKGTMTARNVEGFRLMLDANVTLVVEFFNDGEYPNDYLVTWSDCFCTQEDFSSARGKVIKKKSNQTKFLRIENGNEPKIVYVCLKKTTSKLSYRASLATFSCLYWDLLTKQWRKGCKVIEPVIQLNYRLICQCQHLSLFTGEIIAPSTDLVNDLDIDFSISFTTNTLMVAFIFGLLLTWLLFLLLAHIRDKTMKKNNVIHKLDDNVPGDRNPYLVVVFTGVFYDAQTTADVAFQIIGDKSQSRTHVIKCHGVSLLKRNSQDWFMIYSPTYLGQIRKIKIWHNCKGRYPHWYCDRIIVQDLKIGKQYCFTVKKWFSLIWGSGKIYRELRVRKAGIKISKILFLTQFERDIKDKHIWMSVLTRDFQSNFNSKERVSTGFCFLFVSMLANGLLLSLPKGTPSDSIDQQPNFDFGSTNVLIFFESWIAAIPVSFLIYFFFNNSAPL